MKAKASGTKCRSLFVRRKRDLNPRAGATDLLVFEARPFSRLGIPPETEHPYYNMREENFQGSCKIFAEVFWERYFLWVFCICDKL